MPELRKDPIIGRWVIIATERAKRPSDFSTATPEPYDPAKDPFREGNEHLTPHEVFAIRSQGTKPNQPGWQVRVIPNKFPALRIEGDLDKEGVGMYDRMNGIGAHEVIIETPRHDQELDQQPIDGIAKVIEAYKGRILDLMKDQRFHYILIFKNCGRRAGASLLHPHSQLIATPVTPQLIKSELEGAQKYFEQRDRSIFSDILRQELRDRIRLVYENESFVSYCPFASRFPFELCILPRRHHPDFHHIHADEIYMLADVLKETLGKLGKALNRPQYNLLIHTAPIRMPRKNYWSSIDQDFCWHIEIIPRVSDIAGFEVGTGFYINPTTPEEAAKYLRETKA